MPMNDKPNKLGIMIAVGRPKGAPPTPPFGGGSKSAAPAPPDDDQDQGQDQAPAQGGEAATTKLQRGEAGYKPAEAVCGGCLAFHCDTGDCDKVEGKFRPADSCEQFTPCNPGYLAIKPDQPHSEDQEQDNGAETDESYGSDGSSPQGDGATQGYGSPAGPSQSNQGPGQYGQ